MAHSFVLFLFHSLSLSRFFQSRETGEVRVGQAEEGRMGRRREELESRGEGARRERVRERERE